MRFIGFYDYTVILTYVSLASAILGMMQAAQGNFIFAELCIIFSSVCDIFDGVVARTKKGRSAEQKNFGIQIDALVDLVAFGVAPAVIFYYHGVTGTLGFLVLTIFLVCGVIRLAFFNILEIKRQANPNASGCAKEFRGLPIAYSVLITPIVCSLAQFLPADARLLVYYLTPVAMGFFFILDFKMKKINIVELFAKK